MQVVGPGTISPGRSHVTPRLRGAGMVNGHFGVKSVFGYLQASLTRQAAKQQAP